MVDLKEAVATKKNRRSNKLKSLAPASDAQPVVIILLQSLLSSALLHLHRLFFILSLRATRHPPKSRRKVSQLCNGNANEAFNFCSFCHNPIAEERGRTCPHSHYAPFIPLPLSPRWVNRHTLGMAQEWMRTTRAMEFQTRDGNPIME